MKIAIVQPSFLPWKGFFDIINEVDIFVHLDCVQYTRNDWRNRNRIKTTFGTQWITVPVVKHYRETKIIDIKISYESDWRNKHLEIINQAYRKSAYFREYSWIINDIYSQRFEKLSDLNIYATELICKLLSIKTKFLRSSDLNVIGSNEDKLISIVERLGAKEYVSGPSAVQYISEKKWIEKGIKIIYKTYDYPEYNQLWNGFFHDVSIIDLLFNKGPHSVDMIWNKFNEKN